jgi:hypothetical protein
MAHFRSQALRGQAMRQAFSRFLRVPLALALAGCSSGLLGAGSTPPPAAAPVTYADVVSLADAATLIARVEIRGQAQVEPERAPGLEPGHARLYIEADTEALLYGRGALGESVAYLADVPVGANGKPPKLKKQHMLLFARPVPGNAARLQLVGPNTQLPASPELEAQVRAIATDLAAADSPPRVTGIHDALWVPGNLAGESETQLFLDTKSGEPVTLSIVRRPGQDPRWGVSWNEIVDQSARPPEKDTLEWYRLACSLPSRLPASAVLSSDPRVRTETERDYALVVRDLGPCTRTLPAPILP